MTNQINTSGGSCIDGNANVGNDFVNRDKNIYYISLVGHLLDWVQLEGLFPKIEDKQDFSSIAEAVEGALNTRFETDLADAVAFAGEVIGDFFIKNKDLQGTPPPLAEILFLLLNEVGKNLRNLGYWDVYSEDSRLSLDATEQLYDKHFPIYSSDAGFFLRLQEWSGDFFLIYREHFSTVNKLRKYFTPKQLRVIIVGIVLDLIRLKSEDRVTYQFLQDMANLFNKHKPADEDISF